MNAFDTLQLATLAIIAFWLMSDFKGESYLKINQKGIKYEF